MPQSTPDKIAVIKASINEQASSPPAGWLIIEDEVSQKAYVKPLWSPEDIFDAQVAFRHISG